MRHQKNVKLYVMRANYVGLIDIVSRYLKNNTHMVEIGSYAGESAKFWLMSGKLSALYCVDPWKNGYDLQDMASDCCPMSEVEKEFNINVAGFETLVNKLKMTSAEASLKFKDQSLDFVYIDGCHKKEVVALDIASWRPKIVPGGYIGGHDFTKQSVMEAVFESLGYPDQVFDDTSWIKKII